MKARYELSYTPAQLAIFHPEDKDRAKYTIVPKGRRLGATHGASHAVIEWLIEGFPCLWVDTIHANIDRYFDRYFAPALKANGIAHEWREQKKVLRIGEAYCDFGSAERPENLEGFGYRKGILNEAGIILKNPDLYYKTVLPMFLDQKDSELYAIGTPKGKKLKNGKDHPFVELWEQCTESPETHRGLRFSSYDNPMIARADIDALAAEIGRESPDMVRQEIFGEFIEGVSGNPFAFNFDVTRHARKVEHRPLDVHYGIVDFNVDPFCASVWHIWQDSKGHHAHCVKEVVIRNGTMREMAERLLAINPHRHLWKMSGDKGGTSRRIGIRDNTSMFDELRKEMGLSQGQFTLPPNPTHILSREQCNYVLFAHPDVAIDPSCTGMIADLHGVEVDAEGHILKSDRSKQSQRADLLDTFRYLVNTYLRHWIEHNRRHELRNVSKG